MPEKRRGTGTAGRYGPRYGRVARRRVSEIEESLRAAHECPECGADSVSRAGTGIWECGRCGHKFAGGTYRPETVGGRNVRRAIRAALAGEDMDFEELVELETLDMDEEADAE